MTRKEFLKKTVLSVAVLNGFSISSVFANEYFVNSTTIKITSDELEKITDELNAQFLVLFEWLKENKWLDYFTNELGT